MNAVMGYRLHGMVRAEVEYVMRSSNYSQRSGVLAAQGVNADKLSDELFLARDWENECRLRERVVQKHGSVAIDTGRDQPNADQIARNLAGTSSSAQATMGDTQTSYQILAGFDYPVSETVSVGLRARWMRSGEFAGTVVWDPLRSHVPNLRRDGSEPVDGTMSTDGFSFVGVSLGMKHHF